MNPTKRPHPHFDDRDTLDWNTRWSEAQEHARGQNKLIFVEFGREQCGNCRALVGSAVPHPEVAALLNSHFVALASDCDDPEDEILALAEHMPDAMSLPFVILADAQGRFLAGSEGAQSASSLRDLLQRVAGSPSGPS